MKTVLCVLLALPLCCFAESRRGLEDASSRLYFRVVIPPVFRVLETTAVDNGQLYRVWTNRKSIVINGVEYRFAKVGESTLHVPASSNGAVIIHGL